MKALVVGYGSIGARHARLLAELGCDTAVVSRRRVDFPNLYSSLEHALAGHRPGYVVIASATAEHHDMLEALAAAGFAGDVLIEKPLFDRIRPLPQARFRNVAVAYNLRFHPVIRKLREVLNGQTVLSASAYVGQYLPDWRPGTDYRQSYSANARLGGGALRDLSHEFDYLGWLLGEWTMVAALGGHVSPLEIDSDDLFVLLMRTAECPALSVQVSYLDRVARRQVVINTTEHTITADLVGGTIAVDRDVATFAPERDLTYREMHRAALGGDFTSFCTLDQGLATVRLIDAAERSNNRHQWEIR